MKNRSYFFALCALLPLELFASSLKVNVSSTTAPPIEVGWVHFTDTPFGLLIEPSLNLPQGRYGFHIHEKPNCADFGKAAGGHLDPDHTKAHKGPFDSSGHLGDLPMLVDDGIVPQAPTLAPRLSTEKILNRALVIHAHGDNYSDQPVSLGGGGDRSYCGIIPESVS